MELDIDDMRDDINTPNYFQAVLSPEEPYSKVTLKKNLWLMLKVNYGTRSKVDTSNSKQL